MPVLNLATQDGRFSLIPCASPPVLGGDGFHGRSLWPKPKLICPIINRYPDMTIHYPLPQLHGTSH